MLVRAWIAAAALALAALGCGAPTALLLPTASPQAEVLAWFPEGSMAVALVATDPDDGGVRRMLDALETVAPAVVAAAPAFEQLRPLLGNDLAVGVVGPGQAPLAVLVTRDGGTLQLLADARVRARRATPAGSYRGADLYAADGHAFAVRQDVLLVSATTADLRDALDRRASEYGMEAADLPRGDAHVRASADLRPLVARASARARAVPWIAAADRLTLTVRARPDAAVAAATVGTGADDLIDLDVPLTERRRAPAMADLVATRVAVADLAHVLAVAERAVAAAAPLALLRAAPALPAARRLASGLHGPATVVRDGRRLLLRAGPSHSGTVERGLAQLVNALPRTGVRVRRRAGLYEAAGVRFGMARGVLVAGTARPSALRRVARAPLARPAGARGSLAFASPQHRLAGWASATPERAEVELRLGWP